ncbi:tctex1 domain-containing protein 1-like [Branchiostoma floridae]|uniref:Tctex1 domain-containing protein 1-like n=2 Tax=Branchiostoma floridae TaxID=7739 RepID=A0A9J7KVB0_BRAFL|nr:tctex1 domain-containing protein 1-like [Branchiostoma floridae]
MSVAKGGKKRVTRIAVPSGADSDGYSSGGEGTPKPGRRKKFLQVPDGATPSLRGGYDPGSMDEVMSTVGGSEHSFALHGSNRKVQYENTYKMEPDFKFQSHLIEGPARDILETHLKDQPYDAATCRTQAQDLAGKIMDATKNLNIKRYKLVTIVSIGSLKERPGMHFGSRCLWNDKTDSFTTVKYTNGSLFAVAMIYGLYFE